MNGCPGYFLFHLHVLFNVFKMQNYILPQRGKKSSFEFQNKMSVLSML